MTFDKDNFVAANGAVVDSLFSIANAALKSAERIATLNLEAARTATEDAAVAAKTVLGAKDVQSALTAQSALVQPSVAKAVAYSKSMYEISREAQQQLAELYQAQFGEFQKTSKMVVEQVTKNLPAGSESVLTALEAMISKANSAFGTASVMAQQFSAMPKNR